jgi:hypothetical protein
LEAAVDSVEAVLVAASVVVALAEAVLPADGKPIQPTKVL